MVQLNGSVGAIVFFDIFIFCTCVTVVYYERNRAIARRLLLMRAATGFGRDADEIEGYGATPVLWDVWMRRAVGRDEKLLWDQIVVRRAGYLVQKR